MTPDEFEFQCQMYVAEVHDAIIANDGTVERIHAEGRALVAALQFLDRAYDQTEDAELREQIEATGMSLGPCLALNVKRLHAAVQSAAELADTMSEVTQVTLH